MGPTARDSIHHAIAAYFQAHPLPSAHVLVAVSGGPDSQCLLAALAHLAKSLSFEVVAVGVDHGLRSAAAEELELAAELAERLGIRFVREAVETPRHGNVLHAARLVRYEALRGAAVREGAGCIAVAHTATDQAETVLMRLARGSKGRTGLGMAARTKDVIRPLLTVPRATVLDYLDESRIPYAQDPSNDDPRRARSWTRHHVLPAMRHLSSAFDTQAARWAEQAAEDETYLHLQAESLLTDAISWFHSLDMEKLHNVPRPILRRVLLAWLNDHRISPSARQVQRILEGVIAHDLRTSLHRRRFRIDAGRLWCEQPTPSPITVPISGTATWPGLGVCLRTQKICRVASSEPFPINDAIGVAFDTTGLHAELRMRAWRSGDRLRPFGFQGHIKVGDVFTDQKIPPLARQNWPVVVAGDDVVWVPGIRRSAWAPVTLETSDVLVLAWQGPRPENVCSAERSEARKVS